MVVMSSTGVMYSQPVIPACSAVEGPVYFTIDLSVTFPAGTTTGTTSPPGADEVHTYWFVGEEEEKVGQKEAEGEEGVRIARE